MAPKDMDFGQTAGARDKPPETASPYGVYEKTDCFNEAWRNHLMGQVGVCARWDIHSVGGFGKVVEPRAGCLEYACALEIDPWSLMLLSATKKNGIKAFWPLILEA